MRKILSLVMALAMLLSMTSFASAEEPVVLEWYVREGSAPSNQMVWDAINEYMVEKINVKINFHYVQTDEYGQKMQPMLMAGQKMDIINVNYLHLYDTFWILVQPGLVNTFNVIVLRTFIQSTIPVEMFDAAAIDGASEFRVFRSIVLPLSKAGLATIALFVMVGKWNEWFTGMLYIENPKLVPVQTMLTRIQQKLDFIKNNSDYASTPDGQRLLMSMPTEQTRMAILVVSTLPIIFAYPFFQRFFIQGLTVGSVKG